MQDRELIMLVEDDPAVLSAVRRRLVFEGYRVETCADGSEALQTLAGLSPNLIVLDVMLPGLDGFQLAEAIRRGSDVPILMLTARSAIEDRVTGLERGADDYLVKPFAIEELLARVRALLRRSGRAAHAGKEPLTFADLVLDPITQEVFRNGKALSLTRREYQLLEHFMRHPRQVLTREAIFESVWAHDKHSCDIGQDRFGLKRYLIGKSRIAS